MLKRKRRDGLPRVRKCGVGKIMKEAKPQQTSSAGDNLSGGDNTNIYHDESPVAQTVVEFPTMIDIPVALSAAGEKLAEC